MAVPYDPTRSALHHPGRRPSLLGDFTADELADSLLLCAELSRTAYMDNSAELRSTLRHVGFHDAQWWEERGAQALALRAADFSLVAFRGTEPDSANDLLADVQALLIDWPTGGRVHAGFAREFAKLWPSLERFVAATELPIWLTGHSLGAALAILAASRIRPANLITFGAPRVGEREFGRRLSIAGERVVNCCDAVCVLPPELLGYRHTGRLRYLDSGARLATDPNAPSILADQFHAAAAYTTRHALSAEAVPLRAWADHAPINYVFALRFARSLAA